MKTRFISTKKLTLLILFSALGVVLSLFFWFPFLGTKAYPTQHMINSILGVLLGPLWAALAASIIGTIRIMIGVGTPYAYPGGIPGGIVVGVIYILLEELGISNRKRLTSALTEPLGTLLIGVPLSLIIFAPLPEEGMLAAFLILGTGWAISCIPGSILGLVVLLILDKVGFNRETLFSSNRGDVQ